MQRQRSSSSLILNSRGMITAEFIFSLILLSGLCVILFALNFTLSMAEVAQYIAFSSARAHAAGHIDQNHQIEMAQRKYASLKNNPVLASIFSSNAGSGWFLLSENLEIRGAGQTGETFSEYPTEENRVPQVGVRFDFTPRILTQRIAFLGSTTEDGENLSAKITGLLIREPTQQECWDQMKDIRRDAILDLDSRFKELGTSRNSEYEPMEDNGC